MLHSTSLAGLAHSGQTLLGALILLGVAAPAQAQQAPLPTGGAFVLGAGEISQSSANAMNITQSSARGVIDWKGFSIADQHSVHIDNATGATLNRVVRGMLSQIDGRLTSTGSVYLMNPNGVIVGPSGSVTTGGSFVATTRQIDPAAFMAGGSIIASGKSPGDIVNQGNITSQSGNVMLIARSVRNEGSISAPQGQVTLAAADEVLLATTDGKAEGIFVSAGSGNAGDVTQAGRIEAAAAALHAANGNVFALAGNREGLVQATGTATIDGQLWLVAPEGEVSVGGALRATDADGSGGRVVVNGERVSLADTAVISASGTHGGEVLIGTSAYGTGRDLPDATVIAKGATVLAGGLQGGGRIETSGKALSLAEARIVAGPGGQWLIDPDDITIDTPAAAAIVSSLDAGTNVTQTTTAGGTGGVGDITVAADIVWAGAGDLTLNAYRDINVNNVISGGGDVTLVAGGNVSVGAAVSGLSVTSTAAATTTVGGAISASAGDVTINTGIFVNQAGSSALAASGNWFVYSSDPAVDATGGLTPDFYQYNAPSGTAPAAAGNGLLYTIAPSVSFTLGPVVKDYDGTTTALLDDGNVSVSGLINGDDFTLDGTYASKDAGTGIDVTATNFQANQVGIPVFGYNVTTPSVTDDVGTINRAALTAAIVGNPTKTYNATTAVSLTSANFALTGVAAGETITVNSAASAAYDSPDAGSRTVDATFQASSFSAGGGTSLTNYILPTAATGAGLINPASLLINGVTANDKVYDSTTAAILNTGSATIYGIVPGDTVTLDTSTASGVFATKNVGNAIAVTGAGFTLGGADAANYAIAQPTGLAANITPAALVVSGLVANDKIYDGTTTAILNTGGVQFTGLFAGDDVSASGPAAEVNFATKNAGQDISVTVTGMTLAGADAGNYNLSFSDALVADILQRELTLSGSGTPTKVYDGTTNAVVPGSSVTLGNLVAGESVTLSQAADLQYASKNVGIWDITGTLTPADFQAGPNTLLSNYILPTSGVMQGEITPAPLTIVVVGNPTKPYDGNANASLGPSNFEVDGFVTGEGATVTETSGQYASSNAGTWTVSVSLDENDFDTDPGTMMSNYFIPSPVYGPGTITRIPLGPGVINVDITGNPSKIYDGTTIATLTSDDYSLSGFIAGEGAIVTETVGEYDLKDAGMRSVLVLLDSSDFVPDPGTNLDNYVLPTEATGVGTIFQKALTALIIGNPTKVYNGTARAVVGPANYSIDGLIAGETITVAPGVLANYDSDNAGSRTITATFTADSNFVAGTDTLLSNYALPVTAQGPGTITPAPLVVLGVSAQNKVYDQTTLATLTGSASLFGVISGDTVTLQGGSATGAFATPNVGNGIAVTVSGYAISGADSGNYTLSQPTGLNANITPRGLTVANLEALDKIYDGTTAATLGGSPTLVGVLSGDTVLLNGGGSTASFLQSNVGSNLRVNVGGYALLGPQAGNYTLSQPSGLTADITPALLTGAIIGNPTKTYDGTTSVSLTAANYSLTGFIAGEGGSITQSSGASYDSPNAGPRTVTATLVVSDFVAQSGTLLSNYVLPTSISGAGTINQAALLATIIGNPTKVYDSTTAATLTSANYSLAGFVAGEGATVNQTSGTYDQKNVGKRTVTASLTSGNFTANSGTVLSNYILPTSASGAGTITPASVQVIGIIANDKVYDATTVATLNSTGGDLTGVFAGDVVNLVSTGATGAFATKNVGTDIPVTATGYGISGTDAGNYTVLQPTGLAADIFEATIQLASVTKVYDANRLVPTVGSAYTLAGVIAGDSVGVDASGIAGNYDSKNVGTGKNVTLSGVALTGADAGNYLIASSVTDAPIGIITPATLNVTGAQALDKIYDQNTVAQLDNTNTQLSGVLGSDVVNLAFATTGNFADPNAGTNKPVTTTAYNISGTDAGNYTLVQPQGLTADILQREIFLASVTKVYDGTVALPTASSGYAFNGVLSGDTVTAQTSGVSGQYNDSKNVGAGKPVTVNGLTLTGASGGNYFISSSITDTIGTITQATLTAAIIGNPTKTYDGTNAATLTSGNYQFTGFVAGEGATVTQTAGIYDSVNQGSRLVTASIAGEIVANGGTLLSNYVLPTSANGAGTIDPRLLTVIGVLANDKVYDGTTVATFNTSGASLVNVVSGDTVALDSSAATGVFATKNVGTDIPVTASGFGLSNNPFGNYVLAQPTGLSADITAALLTLTKVSRVYTADTALPTDATAYTLSGVVAGDVVLVDAGAAAASGSYADKNVNTGILVTIGNLAITGADAGNYSIASSLTNQPIGEITPATLSAIIIGTPTKTYDGNTAALLGVGNYQISGFVGGESATINQTAGTYDSANAGSRTVTASLGAGNFDPASGTLLGNYILPTSASGAGQIDPKALAVAIINNPTKTYDGTAVATLNPGNYDLTGFVTGEGATITQTVGTYDSANAGARIVTATLAGSDFSANGGTFLTNYVLPTSATGAGQIDRANLVAAIVNNPTKTYDATTAITLAPANYQLTGFVAGEGATVTETNGVFVSPDAGLRVVNATLDASDFTANSGTLLANYNLPLTATGTGTIDPKALSALIIGNPTKTYDGTTAATLTSGNYQLIGFVGTQGATVTQTAGTYDTPNAGPRTVTATLGSSDFTAGAGTLLSNYILPTTASGAGTIDQAVLTAAIVGTPTKTYDGTTVAALTGANFNLSGFVSGEGADVTQTVGVYDSANAGPRTVTASLAAGDFAATGGTLLSNYVLPTSASGAGLIDRATLTASIIGIPTKTYDATTLITLTSANFGLDGFVAGEGATVTKTTGNFAVPDAGLRTVTTTLAGSDFTANAGTLLSNYNLPTSASGVGLIERALLTATIIGNPTKTYDGTTAATLTSANYQLGGFVGGQGATVTETAGTYGSANVGTRTVTAALGSADFVADAGTSLLNYVLPATATGLGTIDPALLTVAITGNPTKGYDGTRIATLTATDYTLSGFVSGEGATVTQTVGLYDSANVGSRTVTANLGASDFNANSGTLLANYVLPTSAFGSGAIDPKLLTVAIIGTPSKIYDGTTAITLAPGNYQISGFASGEGATITQTDGVFASPNAGFHQITATLAAGDYSANGGTLLSNYVLPTEATGLGQIGRAALIATIVGNPTKTYDGNTAATLASGNYQLAGFIGSDGATVSQTVGTYDSANAGSRTVSAVLGLADFDATGSTLLSNYILPTSASGAGTIDRALLTAAIVNNPTKTYDGTTTATLLPGNFALTGFLAGEGATVTQTQGTYGSANAGTRLVAAMLAAGNFTADSGTLLSNYVLPTAASGLGTIDRATLRAAIVGNPTRIYDGLRDATLTSGNYELIGFVAGEGATISATEGIYDSPNAGPRIVTAPLATSDFAANSGTDLGNYILPENAIGPGRILPKGVTIILFGIATKLYDGTLDAMLTTDAFRAEGFIGRDGIAVGSTIDASYSDKNVGVHTITIDPTSARFVPLPGTLLANYELRQGVSGVGRILPAPLLASIINNPTKVYDGTTAAVLISANFQLAGFANGEGASVTQTVGTYDTKNAGPRSVTATLTGSDFTPAGGTLLSNYLLPTTASGVGTINPAVLTATIIGNPSRVYDGTLLAALTSANFELSGFIAGESAAVTQSRGTYDTKNAGNRTVTANLVTTDFVADGGTLLSNYVLPVEATGPGTISRAMLSAAIIGNPTKTYDGNTIARLTSGNYELVGFIAGEGATVTETAGTYDLPDPGDRTVTALLESGDFAADAGTLLSNYILPAEAVGPGEILEAGPQPCADPFDCLPSPLPLIQTLNNPRFYIPYPGVDPIYYARTNGFAGLPMNIDYAETTVSFEGVLIKSGAPVVNSTEQILHQGNKQQWWYLLYPPAETHDTIGEGQ